MTIVSLLNVLFLAPVDPRPVHLSFKFELDTKEFREILIWLTMCTKFVSKLFTISTREIALHSTALCS